MRIERDWRWPQQDGMPDRKRLRFTRHTQDAILQRELDQSWIERTVREPEWYLPDPRRPQVERRFRAIPEFGDARWIP